MRMRRVVRRASSRPMNTERPGIFTHPLLWSLIAYGAIAGVALPVWTDAVQTDGVSYILLAEHYVRREWGLAVSGHWSPFLSWALTPWIYLGYDPLHASRIIVVSLGAGLVISVWMLAGRLSISPLFRGLAALSVSVMSAVFSVGFVTPDVFAAALLVFYFYLTLDRDFAGKTSVGFLCGAVGGVTYLVKAYAGPFFLVHFTVLSVWRAASGGRLIRRPTWLRSWVAGVVGFSLIAGPWIGIISTKYGHPTFSTAAGFNRAVIAPGVIERGRFPIHIGSVKLPPGRMNVWEDLSLLNATSWSPFDSDSNLRYQVKEIGRSGRDIANLLWRLDLLKLGIGSLITALFLALRCRRPDRNRDVYRWAVATVLIYCSGYLLIYSRSSRYYWPIIAIMLLLVFHFADRLFSSIRSGSVRLPSPLRLVLISTVVALPVLSFVFPPLRTLVLWRSGPPFGQAYRILSMDMAKRGIDGPIASTGEYGEGGFQLSYYLKQPYLGPPENLGPDLESRLCLAGVRTFLVWGPLEVSGARFIGTKGLSLVVQYRAATHPGLENDLTVYSVEPRVCSDRTAPGE